MYSIFKIEVKPKFCNTNRTNLNYEQCFKAPFKLV